MSMSLDTFLRESREELEAFEAWWRQENAKSPERFPMEFPKDNAGLWWEMLHTFVEERPDLKGEGS